MMAATTATIATPRLVQLSQLTGSSPPWLESAAVKTREMHVRENSESREREALDEVHLDISIARSSGSISEINVSGSMLYLSKSVVDVSYMVKEVKESRGQKP